MTRPNEPPKEGISFEARVALRPRSIDETFDLALAYARSYHRDLLPLGFALAILATGLIVALDAIHTLSWAERWAAVLIVAPLIERAVIAYGGRHLFGNAPKIRTALANAFRRPLLMFGSAIPIPLPWVVLLLSGGTDSPWQSLGVLLGMFWPFLLGWWLYFSTVILLEGVPFQAGWKRAAVLISYRYGRGLTFVVFGAALRAIAAISADLSAQFVVSLVLQLGSPIDTVLENGGSWPAILGFFAMCPYVALARLFDYVDARTRLEGWDIQVRFKSIAARARRDRRAA